MINKILLKLFGIRMITSQCGEDLIIDSIIPSQRNGFYVDIGANHPIKYSNTFFFYKKGWSGINIEPNPHQIKLFNFFRKKDINLNIGIGEKDESKTFYLFKEHTLSTFDGEVAEKYLKMGHTLQESREVKIMRLENVLSQYLKDRKIDILSIDTEGFDFVVLKSNDWIKYRPNFIILETLQYERKQDGMKLNHIYDPFMDSIGYVKVADTHINTIYQNKN